MKQVLAVDRWLCWTIVALVVLAGFLWWQIETYSIEQDVVTATDQIVSSNKKSPTAGNNYDISKWKTYRNEKYGFEFQYPSSLFLAITKDGLVSLKSTNKDDDLKETDCDSFSVYVESGVIKSAAINAVGFMTRDEATDLLISYKETPEEIAEQIRGTSTYFSGGSMLDPRIGPATEIKINGVSGLEYKTSATCHYNKGGVAGSGDFTTILLFGNDNKYADINIFWSSAVTDKILSTFNFFEPKVQ